MRATCLFLGVLVALAFASTPTLADPGERAHAPRKAETSPRVAQEVEKLKKELQKLQRYIDKARQEPDAPKAALAAQEKRLVAARKRLAAALARASTVRGAAARRGARARKHRPPTPTPPRRADQPRRERQGRAGHGPEAMTAIGAAVRRLYEQNRGLTKRIGRLEQQIRRIGSALGKRRTDRATPPPRARRPEGRPGPTHGRGPGGPPAAHPGPAAGRHGQQGVEARLERIERMLGHLVRSAEQAHGAPQARRGNKHRAAERGARRGRGHGRAAPQRGPRWMRGARAMQGARRRGGPPAGMRGHVFGRSGPRAHAARGRQTGSGPMWRRMLRQRMSRGFDRGLGGMAPRGRPVGNRPMRQAPGRAHGDCPFCDS